MRFEGRVWKDGKFWLVEVPLLDAITQGHTKSDAFEMIKDWVRSILNDPKFHVDIYPGKGEYFELGSSDAAKLVALMLRRQREKNSLSLAEAARRLDQSSRNAYARYEQGVSVPTVEKLAELLHAIDPKADLVLKVAH